MVDNKKTIRVAAVQMCAELGEVETNNLNRLKATLSIFAKVLGVPVVHAAHAGRLDGFNPFDPQMPYRSRFLGESQIVDGRGSILARRSYEEKEGVVLADITKGRVPQTRPPIPDGFWIPDLPQSVLKAWNRQNEFGRDYYRRVTLPHRRAINR